MKSSTYTRSFELKVSTDEIFPLFSPEGEKLWVPDWDYTNIMGTTDLTEDYVFLTENHDHGMTDAIWLVKAYDPESHFVQFYKIEPGYKVGVVTVKCSAISSSKTNVQVTYKYIAISADGESFIQNFNEDDYEKFIDEWQSLLIEYLKMKK